MNEREAPNLVTAQMWNETAPHRCIGLTIETRPDRCLEKEIQKILELGGTRVELGVQTTYDDVLEQVKRGHSTRETIRSTKLLKDSGLKIVYHMMPGLPGTDPEMDIGSFRKIFENTDYRPDMLKIYPTLVVKGTQLYQMWKEGAFDPLTTEGAVDIIKEAKKFLPPYVRIQRIQRDIPAKLIEAGVKKSNLRQLVGNALTAEGEKCQCIRCREAGHTSRKAEKVELLRYDYDASGGKEVFLSYEDVENEVLVGYLRLRFPDPESENGKLGRAIVRELKVSGLEVSFDRDSKISNPSKVSKESGEKLTDARSEGEDGRFQHLGYGRKLMKEAERIAHDEGVSSIIVLSGIGVRNYYRSLGYERSGPYMEKKLSG